VNRALRAATMGVLLLSPVVVSACSAGQTTQTATQERDKTGAQAQVGNLSVRQAQLVHPREGSYEQGDDAELQVAIVNGGADADTLIRVEGEGFGSAEIQGASGGASTSASASTSAGPTASASPSPTAGASASPGTTPSAGASATPSASAAPTSSAAPSTGASAGSGSSEVEIPARSSVYVGGDESSITLTDLDQSLTTGQYLEVTFVFENAGEVTLPITVATASESESRGEAFDFHEEEGANESAARSREESAGGGEG
jgi:copper(I)-binding protein